MRDILTLLLEMMLGSLNELYFESQMSESFEIQNTHFKIGPQTKLRGWMNLSMNYEMNFEEILGLLLSLGLD